MVIWPIFCLAASRANVLSTYPTQYIQHETDSKDTRWEKDELPRCLRMSHHFKLVLLYQEQEMNSKYVVSHNDFTNGWRRQWGENSKTDGAYYSLQGMWYSVQICSPKQKHEIFWHDSSHCQQALMFRVAEYLHTSAGWERMSTSSRLKQPQVTSRTPAQQLGTHTSLKVDTLLYRRAATRGHRMTGWHHCVV